jgi:hypothetical protein
MLLDDVERRGQERERQPSGPRVGRRPGAREAAREAEQDDNHGQAREERDCSRARAALEELRAAAVGGAEHDVRERVRELAADDRDRQCHQPGEAFPAHALASVERVKVQGNHVLRLRSRP